MEKKLTWVEVLILLACFLGAFAVIGLAFAHFTHNVDKDKVGDAATWFGAIGTVAAFFAVICVAVWEAKQRKDEGKRRGEVVLQAMLALAYEHLYLVRTGTDRLQRPAPGTLVLGEIDLAPYTSDIEKGLHDIRMHELPRASDIKLMVIFLRLVRQARKYIQDSSVTLGDLHASKGDHDHADRQILQVIESAKWMIDALREEIGSYGARPIDTPEHLASLGISWREKFADQFLL